MHAFHIAHNGDWSHATHRTDFAVFLGGRKVAIVSRTQHFNHIKAALAKALDDHQIMVRHARNDIVAFDFMVEFSDTRHARRGNHNHISRSGFAVSIRILSRHVDIEITMAVMLNRPDIESPRNKLGNHPNKQCCFTRVMTTDESNSWTWTMNATIALRALLRRFARSCAQ